MRIGIVAGEISGDMIGSGLMRSLRARFPDAQFEGIGGPLMLEQGFNSFVPMERLSVMGLVEVLGRIFELIRIRRQLIRHWKANPPDVFIGIDAPDFNLGLEQALRKQGIKTAHYVSPSVWAWREKRVFKIAKAVDLMLALFPFEAKFYEKHGIPVVCVGHHLADKIPLKPPVQEAREALGIAPDAKVVCLMPGSRQGEVARLGELFLNTAERIVAQRPEVQFILPAATEARQSQIETMLKGRNVPVTVLAGQSHHAMAAADTVLLASGTATLEAMLLKKPMVVSYVISNITYWIVKKIATTEFVSLPNCLAGRELVPELLQENATVEKLSDAVLKRLDDNETTQQLQQEFLDIHLHIKRNADEQAAQAIAELMQHNE